MSFPKWDTDVFLFLNSFHDPVWDRIMWAFSHKWVWIPMYLVLLVWMLIKSGRKNWPWLVLALGLCIFLADFVSSGIIKDWVERPRPSREPMLEGWVYLVNGYRGGPYGFVSSHSANSFAFACFVSGIIRNRILTPVLFVWAGAVAYSRIYLGVHYPLDILGGAAVGLGAAWVSLYVYRRWVQWKN